MVSGGLAHVGRKGFDMKRGVVLVIGGIVGTIAGGWLFALLQATGQIDTVIALIYVVLLGGIGGMMAMESLQAIAVLRGAKPRRPRKRRHHPMIAAFPFRTRFYASGLYISPLAPLLLGVFPGTLTVLLGVGRSEEHTSELQSLMRISYAVFCLKKKKVPH